VLAPRVKAALTYAQTNRHQPMTIEPDAIELLDWYYDELMMMKGDGGLSRRLADAALRFALTRAALERRDDITKQDVRLSMALTEYARMGMGWVFGQITVSEDAQRVLRALYTLGGSSKMSGLLIPAFQSRNAGARLHAALDELLKYEKVTTEIEKGPGRSATVIRLANTQPNPKLHAQIPSSRARKREINGSDNSDDENMGLSVQGGSIKVGTGSGEATSLWDQALRIFADD
jgi:hypothetical protein